MNNCDEIMELISSYADDELSQSDRRCVEEHLGVCESCSALLELYREISVAVDESGVPAPEALLDGVMKKVMNEESNAAGIWAGVEAEVEAGAGVEAGAETGGEVEAGTGAGAGPDAGAELDAGADAPAVDNAGRSKRARVILLRYAPLAACLTIALLAIPWIMNSVERTGQPVPESAGGSLFFTDTTADSKNNAMDDSILESGGFDIFATDGGMTGSGDAAAPAAPPPQAAAPPDSANSSTQGRRITAEDDIIEYPIIAPDAPLDSPLDPSDSEFQQTFTPDDMAGAEAEAAPGVAVDWDTENDNGPWGQDTVDDQEYMESPAPPGAKLDFFDNYGDAYAWIEITGELPETLKKYEPQPLDGQLNWKAYYSIPRDAAQKLISEIKDRSDVLVTYNYESGGYAIVLYSPVG